MSVFCIDIGNTHTHFGLWDGSTIQHRDRTPTSTLAQRGHTLDQALSTLASQTEANISYCSVVPKATEALETLLHTHHLSGYHLRHDQCPALPINYPKPQEIGQDRLANSFAARYLHGTPAIVIDMGTAVTFDIISPDGAYEGGIIAPGLNLMSRYLHEQTALLPELDINDLLVSTGVGKSTLEAMKLGCAIGFAGMIGALLKRVLTEMADQNDADTPPPAILATGGSAGHLPRSWAGRIHWDPELTLKGLAEAWKRRPGERLQINK